jgi:hypothetical protein
MFVQDYYAELQKGMIRAGVQEEMEDKICHFYSGLHTEIQDTVDRLFQLAILVKKELQGRQVRKMKTFFMLRSAPMTPSRTATPSGARSSTTHSASHAPSILLTPSTTAPHATDPSKTSVSQGAAVAKP